MKHKVDDIDKITIEVKFKDGTVIKAENPITLLISYQNFDAEQIGNKFKEEHKTGLADSKDDIGGVQVLGTQENLQFALFTMLRHLVDTIGSHAVIETFNQIMLYIFEEHKQMHELEEAAKDKSKPRN